jgi:hypothetical protein
MEAAVNGLTNPPTRGPWRRWLDFWFAPADPTTMGFIRIVTGCLVLYTHLAYSFDLGNFFGPDAWYGLESVNRERRELPHVAPSLTWDDPQRSAAVPDFPHRRQAFVAYMRNLIETRPTRAELDPALRYMDRLQKVQGPTVRDRYDQDGLAYLLNLSPDPTVRRNQLAAVENEAVQDKGPGNRPKEPVPAIVNGMLPADRKAVAAEIEALFQSLPRDPSDRAFALNHLIEMLPDQRASFLAFMRELTTVPPEEQQRRISYLEYWNVEERLVHRKGSPIFSIWFHVTDPAGMAAAHAVALVIFLLFTLGVFTRVTSVLTWLAAVSYIHRTQQVLFGMDTMMNILLFYCMIGNCGAALSVDRVVNRYRAVRQALRKGGVLDGQTLAYLAAPPLSVSAGFGLRLLQVHFCFIYMASGLSKLKGGAWWNHHAYWDTLVNPEFTLIHYQWYEWLIRQLAEHRAVYSVAAAGGIAITFIAEIGLPFLIWTRVRPYIMMVAFMLHAGIAVFMGLWIFSLLMMTLLLCYLPGAAIRERIFGNGSAALPRIGLRYNPRSDRQARAAALARAFDFDGRLDLVEAAGRGDVVRVESEGKELAGEAAVRGLFAQLGGLRPLRWVLWVPGLSGAVMRWFGGAAEPTPAATKPQVPAAS